MKNLEKYLQWQSSKDFGTLQKDWINACKQTASTATSNLTVNDNLGIIKAEEHTGVLERWSKRVRDWANKVSGFGSG